MKKPDRKLLILLPDDRYDDVALEHQTVFLHELLDDVQTLEHTIQSVEFLNLNRGGITNSPLRIENALRRRKQGAFQFILYKN